MSVKFAKFLKYVETIIIGLMKEKIVRFWMYKVWHFENATTNNIEYSHDRLKQYLLDSKDGFCNGLTDKTYT